MPDLRIAALFDAENIDCSIVAHVLTKLRQHGIVQTRMAVGDFTVLGPWLACAREHGIELVMQPNLGRGKNSADVALTIEAMDLLQGGRVNAFALITHDRDFTPLAYRLRKAGLAVFGFGRTDPTESLRAACTSFEVIAPEPVSPVFQMQRPAVLPPALYLEPQARPLLSAKDIATLRRIVDEACADRAIDHAQLTAAVNRLAPELATRLKGKFLKTLIAHGVIQRVGSGTEQKLRRADPCARRCDRHRQRSV